MKLTTFAAVTNIAILAFIAFMVANGHGPWWALTLYFFHTTDSK